MRALGNADFLAVWDEGQRFHPLDRGLLAIRSLLPGRAVESVADWPLGRRNQALAELHAECFGSRLQGWTVCDRCGEKMEFAVDCRSLIERQREQSSEPIVFKGSAFRVPSSRDLARIAGERDSETAALRLVDFCLIEDASGENGFSLAAAWSGEDLEELGKRMIQADPLAEIALAFECPACKCTSEEAIDLPAFFWAELEAHARRLLREVHSLAAAYGWSEEEILSLSDSRRAIYLEMVEA